MSVFVQQSNGSIRRVRGSFGGNRAWRQHDGCHCDTLTGVCKCDNSKRIRLRTQLVEELAMQELHLDCLPGGHREEKRRVGQGIKSIAPTAEPSSMVALTKPRSARARIKVVITESGKMVAVPLN